MEKFNHRNICNISRIKFFHPIPPLAGRLSPKGGFKMASKEKTWHH
jgi:hypothetical protein